MPFPSNQCQQVQPEEIPNVSITQRVSPPALRIYLFHPLAILPIRLFSSPFLSFPFSSLSFPSSVPSAAVFRTPAAPEHALRVRAVRFVERYYPSGARRGRSERVSPPRRRKFPAETADGGFSVVIEGHTYRVSVVGGTTSGTMSRSRRYGTRTNILGINYDARRSTRT